MSFVYSSTLRNRWLIQGIKPQDLTRFITDFQFEFTSMCELPRVSLAFLRGSISHSIFYLMLVDI